MAPSPTSDCMPLKDSEDAVHKVCLSHILDQSDPCSKASIDHQLQRESQRPGGVGLMSSMFQPYRVIGGDLDLERERPLLPMSRDQKTWRPIRGDTEDYEYHLLLPLHLKGCFWNGERWSREPFEPRLAREYNGSSLLRQELKKSEERLASSRRGNCILASHKTLAAISKEEKETRRPSIPPLDLNKVASFDASEETARNKALLHEYRREARHFFSDRNEGVGRSFRLAKTSRKLCKTGRTNCGVPPYALEMHSLNQLSHILDKETDFASVQQKHNRRLLEFLKSWDVVRPYTLRQKYAGLKEIRIDQLGSRSTSERARNLSFIDALGKYQWYKDLMKRTFICDHCPTTTEWIILDRIRSVIEDGRTFGKAEYVDMLRFLDINKYNMNEPAASKTLNDIRYIFKVTDEDLLEGFIKSCFVVPTWLAGVTKHPYGRISESYRSPKVSRGSVSA